MGTICRQATPYRDRQCPECALWFTARGLQGHLRFVHGAKKQQPTLGIRESQELAFAKQVLAGAKFQKDNLGKIGEDTQRMLFDRVLLKLGEQFFGDQAIPPERLHPIVGTQLRLARVTDLEQKADQAEAELKKLRTEQQ